MSKRFYYTCPIQAAYMVNELKIRIVIGRVSPKGTIFEPRGLPTDILSSDIKDTLLGDLVVNTKYLIAEESKYIFSPQVGDIGIMPDKKTLVKYILVSLKGEQYGWSYLDGRPLLLPNKYVEIIMRKGKLFFQPKQEEINYEQ